MNTLKYIIGLIWRIVCPIFKNLPQFYGISFFLFQLPKIMKNRKYKKMQYIPLLCNVFQKYCKSFTDKYNKIILCNLEERRYMNLKVQLQISNELYADIAKYLTEKGIEISADADFILIEKDKYVDTLNGRNKESGEIIRIPTNDIVFMEAFGHDIEIQTKDKRYTTKDRLYQLLQVLDPQSFVRISNSVIVHKSYIAKIKPLLSQRFILTMITGHTVDVTRTYYYAFKDSLGI